MAVGTVEFYSMPGGLTSGEYPILSPDQDISSYLVHSEERCKYTHDVLQAIGPIKVFEGYDTVNIAKIVNDFYWVPSWTTQSLQTESVTFGLVYNAPTSQLRLGQSITGSFTRTPVNVCPYMPDTIITDAMEFSRKVDLPHMDPYVEIDKETREETITDKLYWVEVTSTTDIRTGSQSNLTRYGFFAAMTDGLSQRSVYSKLIRRTSQYTRIEAGVYPTISTIINYPESLGIQADTIVQISISERCPYAYYQEIITETYDHTHYYRKSVKLTGRDPYGSEDTNFVTVYIFSGILNSDTSEDTISMNLSEMERMTGSVRIVNESGTAIATIPTQYGSNIELGVKTISDFSGIYTELIYDDRVLCTLNEGHLPWVGDAWLQYASRSLDADRASVALANQQVRQDLDISLEQSMLSQRLTQINAVANVGLFNAFTGAAGATMTIVEAGIRGRAEREAMTSSATFTEYKNEMEQKLKEKVMKAEPGTAYSMGYGLIYVYQTFMHPSNLRLEMPANLTTAYYNEHISRFGYPAEGTHTFNLTSGYISGRVYDSTTHGQKFDLLNESLRNGFIMRSLT